MTCVFPSKRVRRALAGIIVAAAAGCAGAAPTEPGSPPAELQALPRPLTSSEQRIVDAGNDFSFALFRRLSEAQPGSGVFVSPLSASMALGMTMNGAAGATFDAMRQTLGFGSTDEQQINGGYHGLLALLRGLDASTQLEVANSIWYRQDLAVNPSFLQTTRSAFDAEVRALNFADAPGTLAAVNGWVNDKTHGKIPSILESVDPSDVMYLLNAIYFKGSWRDRFDPRQTRDASFHAADGSTQPAKLMHRQAAMLYGSTSRFQAAELPYGNGAFAMTILLPSDGTNIDDFTASLNRSDWNSWTAQLKTQEVILDLPRFTLSYERMLNDDLSAMGMGIAFDRQRADFSRIASVSADQRLFISFVKQKAYVDVNEEGTEAAAVTIVGIGVTSAPAIPTMRVDRPFVFVIRERLSGTVLFMGKITKLPSS